MTAFFKLENATTAAVVNTISLKTDRLNRVGPLVFAGFIVCMIALPAIADPPLMTRGRDRPDPVSGSCQEFLKAAESGVHNEEGVVYSWTYGVTTIRPTFNGLAMPDFVDSMRKGLFEPPFKVESYLGDRRRGNPGLFCARAFDFAIDLGAQMQVSFLDWHHGKKPDSECAKEWERIKKTILDHEHSHENDAKPVLVAAAARLRGLSVENCAASKEDAASGLAPKIASELAAWSKSISDDWDAHIQAFHKTSTPLQIDCSKCGERFVFGSIECVIELHGPGYYHTETQRWDVGRIARKTGDYGYPASWSTLGTGKLTKPGMTAKWTTKAEGQGQLAVEWRLSDNKLVFHQSQGPVGAKGGVAAEIKVDVFGSASLEGPALVYQYEEFTDDVVKSSVSGSRILSADPTFIPMGGIAPAGITGQVQLRWELIVPGY